MESNSINIKLTEKLRSFTVFIFFMGSLFLFGQNKKVTPDLSKCNDVKLWKLEKGKLSVKGNEIHLKAENGGSILWLKNYVFANGTIEFDIKGRDVKGQNFVGLAFHGADEKRYEAIYFRPFNFQSHQKQKFSIQYISQPKHTWNFLRKNHPGIYENSIGFSVDPNKWFHVKLVINSPTIQVFVNNHKQASLEVKQLNSIKTGSIGFWVGYLSEANFKNLKISPKK